MRCRTMHKSRSHVSVRTEPRPRAEDPPCLGPKVYPLWRVAGRGSGFFTIGCNPQPLIQELLYRPYG